MKIHSKFKLEYSDEHNVTIEMGGKPLRHVTHVGVEMDPRSFPQISLEIECPFTIELGVADVTLENVRFFFDVDEDLKQEIHLAITRWLQKKSSSDLKELL